MNNPNPDIDQQIIDINAIDSILQLLIVQFATNGHSFNDIFGYINDIHTYHSHQLLVHNNWIYNDYEEFFELYLTIKNIIYSCYSTNKLSCADLFHSRKEFENFLEVSRKGKHCKQDY